MKPFMSVSAVCVLFAIAVGSAAANASADEVLDLKEEIRRLKESVEELKSRLVLVESERDSLQLRLNRLEKDTSKAGGDLFQIGMRWQGSRFLVGAQSAPHDRGQKWSMVITERDGERFKGQIEFKSRDDQIQQLEVSGSAPTKGNGRVVFKSAAIGVLQQSFDGVLKGNQISLTWEGSGIAGKRIGGTANLSR